ncbi:MAG: arginine--tRNA ligase [Acidobacteria bacterium]|nr:arginine--tRNA ligase [Acidobacteriota bacterium]
MRLIDLQESLRARVGRTAEERFGVALEQVASEVPPRTELGDLAFPVAFDLAKRVKAATGQKANPRAIAEELRAALAAEPGVGRVEVAGAGYLNVFFDRPAVFVGVASRAEEQLPPARPAEDRGKVIVEHTNINPNKAAHIGHMRNAVLGDTFVRILRASGDEVEVDNYIDNTGVQVADVVVGFMHIERMTLADVRRLDESLPADRPFDYYCWDLYSRVGLFYRGGDPAAKELPELLKLRSDTLHAIEAGANETAALADYVATRIVHRHLDTMERLGIRYDLLPRESDILHSGFWLRAFDRLKETGTIRLEAEGKTAGCWVMPTDSHAGTDEHDADKIIVRSNGTVTYAGKDIAYQLWKLGRLGADFHYKPFRAYPDGHTVWVSTSDAAEATPPAGRPAFGRGRRVYNVIDSRQSYTQDVVRRGAAAVAPDVGEAGSVHLSYEMVALSPAAAAELGFELSGEDQTRSHVEMSGRRGLGVKVDDLVNTLEASALREVEARHALLPDAEKRATAHAIAVGALRFFLLKWTRNSLIAFDFKEALSFEGETGTYCQNAAVRVNSIFRKLGDGARVEGLSFVRAAAEDEAARGRIASILSGESGDELWSLFILASRLDETVAQAAALEEPAHLAKYVFQLSKNFNYFYHRHRILGEEDDARRAVLIQLADHVRAQLTRALATLGIEVPERM